LIIEAENIQQDTQKYSLQEFVSQQLQDDSYFMRPVSDSADSENSVSAEEMLEIDQCASFPLRAKLQEIDLPSLLELAAANIITGKLCLRNVEQEGYIFFVEGNVTHAAVSNVVGDEAVMLLSAWKTGSTYFRAGKISRMSTINESLEQLIERGTNYANQIEYLHSCGFTEFTTAHKNMLGDYVVLLEQISVELKVPIEFLKQFYLCVGSNQSLTTLAKQFNLRESDFAKIVYYLHRYGLIELVRLATDDWVLPTKRLDEAAIDEIHSALCNPDTGIYTHNAFLYLLHFEYQRSFRARAPLSVLLFDILYESESEELREEDEMVRSVLSCINSMKRRVDVLAHYEDNKYALILPKTTNKGAYRFATKMQSGLVSQLGADLMPAQARIVCGASSIPEDSVDLSRLLSGAEFALQHAIDADDSFVAFGDVKPHREPEIELWAKSSKPK